MSGVLHTCAHDWSDVVLISAMLSAQGAVLKLMSAVAGQVTCVLVACLYCMMQKGKSSIVREGPASGMRLTWAMLQAKTSAIHILSEGGNVCKGKGAEKKVARRGVGVGDRKGVCKQHAAHLDSLTGCNLSNPSFEHGLGHHRLLSEQLSARHPEGFSCQAAICHPLHIILGVKDAGLHTCIAMASMHACHACHAVIFAFASRIQVPR